MLKCHTQGGGGVGAGTVVYCSRIVNSPLRTHTSRLLIATTHHVTRNARPLIILALSSIQIELCKQNGAKTKQKYFTAFRSFYYSTAPTTVGKSCGYVYRFEVFTRSIVGLWK